MSWDERIARARSLAARTDAPDILHFYAGLADYQRRLCDAAPAGLTLSSLAGRAAASVPGLLGWLRREAPEPLARAAAAGDDIPRAKWTADLQRRLDEGQPDGDPAVDFIVEAVLQPFVERARLGSAGIEGRPDGPPAMGATARCPFCASVPVAGTLREEGQGARRSLACALCFLEWGYPRVQCLACGDNRFDALPVYTADAGLPARLDACDTCRTYVKTIDMTKDGHAVPIVDDLATVTLDLWARDRGYHRLHPGLLRL